MQKNSNSNLELSFDFASAISFVQRLDSETADFNSDLWLGRGAMLTLYRAHRMLQI